MPHTDRRFFLLMAVALLVVAIFFGAFVLVPSTENTTPAQQTSPKVEDGRQASSAATEEGAEVHSQCELFAFDPNTANEEQLLRLGLQPWQVRNIMRYRSRGGIYRTKEDFARVYGLTVGQYRRLKPYIHIGADYKPAANLPEVVAARNQSSRYGKTVDIVDNLDNNSTVAGRDSYVPKLRQGEHVAVNIADTTLLMRIPGIGSYYARQIVRLRERLGGFALPNQLLDIDGFPETALAYITVDADNVKRLNVNRLTLQQLKRHPYINYYQARAIVDMRRLYGTLHSMSQLAELKEFSVEDIKRLAPYIEF